jgi:hypothetical protein
MHNTSKVLMGCPQSSERTVVSHKGEIPAGTAVRRKSDGTLSTVSTDGDFYGVSLGRDQSKAGYSSICVAGLGIPLTLTAGLDPTVGGIVSISNSTGFGASSSATATAATYATGRIGGTGVNGGQQEDGTTVGAALIDFPGGL